MKDEIFTIDGEKYKVIKMLYNDKTDKSYIVYENCNKEDKNIYASTFSFAGNQLVLDEITSDEEWNFIDSELGDVYE